MTPLVSVVIPTRDRAQLLKCAIDSVLRQQGDGLDEGRLEVIVVDDASNEDIAAIVARYRRAVWMIRNETSRERGASRNLGAAKATGTWLAFLDSDDEWEDEKLSTQLAAVGSARACVTGSWLIDEAEDPLGMGESSSGSDPEELLVHNPYRAAPSSLLIDRALFASLGGFPEDRDVQGSEDWLFMVKLHHAGFDPVFVPRPLVRYRVHGGNSTASPAGYLPTTLAAVDWLVRHELIDPKVADAARAEKFEVAARAYALRGDIRQAYRCLAQATALVGPSERFGLCGRTLKRAVRVMVRRAINSVR